MATDWTMREPPGDVIELLLQLGGTVPDNPGRWVTASDPTDVVLACVKDLDPMMRDEFLEAFAEPWTLLLVLHDRHPSLGDIAKWVENRPHVLVLATPSGPPSPAVAIFTRPTFNPELWDADLAVSIGVEAARLLPDGSILGVTNDITNMRVWVGDRWGPHRCFEYPDRHVAVIAAEEWNGTGDPQDGWVRAYPPMFRRRPDGRPESEYEAP